MTNQAKDRITDANGNVARFAYWGSEEAEKSKAGDAP